MPSNNPFINAPTSSNSAPMPFAGSSNEAFEVDLSDVQNQGYAIPDGTYRAKCIDVSQDVSRSGNPMFIWQFELVGGQYAGRQFKSWTAITPAAMWKVAETVMALGVGQSGQVVKFKRSDVIGKTCGLVMEQDEYNGNATSKIARVIPESELNNAN